jgi:hypothetical protein
VLTGFIRSQTKLPLELKPVAGNAVVAKSHLPCAAASLPPVELLELRAVPGRGVEARVRVNGAAAVLARMGSVDFAAQLLPAASERAQLEREAAQAESAAPGQVCAGPHDR